MNDKFDYEMFNDITEEEHLDILNTLNEINNEKYNIERFNFYTEYYLCKDLAERNNIKDKYKIFNLFN